MIVGIFKARLQCIVVYIGDGKLSFHSVNTECLELKIRHGTGSVLSQRLIDFQTDLASDLHASAPEMACNDLLRNSVAHYCFLSEILVYIFLSPQSDLYPGRIIRRHVTDSSIRCAHQPAIRATANSGV